MLWASSPREFVELVSEYLRSAEDKKQYSHVDLGSFFSVGEAGIE